MDPLGSNTVFHVSDMQRALDFYQNTLGFIVDFQVGEPTTYAGLSWKNCYLHLGSQYPYKNNTGHGNIYIYFKEVDTLYKKFKESDVTFLCDIGDRDYGVRDFAISDPDGNQLGFGAEVK